MIYAIRKSDGAQVCATRTKIDVGGGNPPEIWMKILPEGTVLTPGQFIAQYDWSDENIGVPKQNWAQWITEICAARQQGGGNRDA